jgi:hypothetical protein
VIASAGIEKSVGVIEVEFIEQKAPGHLKNIQDHPTKGV